MKHTLGTLKLTPKDKSDVLSVLDSNWLSPGKKVEEFEKAFSGYHHQKYGRMVNSGTDALRIALAAMKEKYGWKDGDRVFVPAVTFVATVNVVLQLNLKPHILDVGHLDFNLNPWRISQFMDNQAAQGVDPKARCVIPVHLAGRPCDMKTILEMAKKYDLKVLEDSCETMGVPGIGLGDVTAFSFYAAHLLVTGVGGMATTNDKELDYLMWSYSNHGRREAKRFVFDRLGYSCRATEFEAALGLNQLPKLQWIIDQRRRNAAYLYDKLKDFDDLYVNFFPESSCMFFPVMIREWSKIKKFELMAHLEKNGIEVRELMPLTNQPCYKDILRNPCISVARHVEESGFYIGCHQGMTLDDLDEVVAAFKGMKSCRRKGISFQPKSSRKVSCTA